MTRIAVGVEIDAPVDTVWVVVEPIERHVEWMADAESITFTTDDRRGVGTAFVCVTRVGPVRVRDVMSITEWSPPAAMGVAHRGIVSGSGRFTLTPIDFGRRTRFEWREELRFPWFLGGRLVAPFAARFVLRPIWLANLRRLRSLVESG